MNGKTVNIRSIMPSQGDLDPMGRRRYQKPSVQRTKRKDSRDDCWYIRYRVDKLTGTMDTRRVEKTRVLGLCRDMGKREAEKCRDLVLKEVNEPVVAIQSQVLFGKIIEEFLSFTVSEVRSNTHREYESYCRQHIGPAFSEMRLCDMTPQVCQRWLNGLQMKRGINRGVNRLSRTTRGLILRLFRIIWGRATDWGYVREVCPLRKASLGPMEAGRQKTLPTSEQFRALVQALDEPFRSILLVATFTGLRISEILGLQGGDITNDRLEIQRSVDPYGEVHPPKSIKSSRVVPIAHLREVLIANQGKAPTEFIFDTSYRVAQRALKAAAVATNIDYPGFGWHTFRRASVTWGKRAGASQGDSMSQHGHSDAKTNAVYYVEDDFDMKRRAELEMKVFDAVMFGGQKGGRA